MGQRSEASKKLVDRTGGDSVAAPLIRFKVWNHQRLILVLYRADTGQVITKRNTASTSAIKDCGHKFPL